MNRFISISARTLLMVFAGVALLQTGAKAGSLEERFQASLNTEIQNVKAAPNPDAKREMLGEFLKRVDHAMNVTQNLVPAKDKQALQALQAKLRADYADLTGTGSARIANADLNHFADYVQQDVEQAGGVYISVGALIIILILLIIFL